MEMTELSTCMLCPRNCGVDRLNGKVGYCGVTGEQVFVTRAALHMWEEDFITGKNGSGAVFFAGCSLKCVYCQNYSIANVSMAAAGKRPKYGKMLSIEELAEVFLQLEEKGAENINLVTPTHYSLQIIESVKLAKDKGLKLPIVYNCSGYEKVETLKMLKDTVDIYLMDFKYYEPELAERYSNARDYVQVAKAALKEMVEQKKSVVVRNLLLPNHTKNTEKVIKYIYETYKDEVCISIMNQYTNLENVSQIKELNRKVTKREYEKVVKYALDLGVTNAYIQEGNTAKEGFIPEFDGSGLN